MNIRSVTNAEFLRYGIILQYDVRQIITYVKKSITIPGAGSIYVAKLPNLHDFHIIDTLKKDIYGELPIEAGLCHGHNSTLTGLEYHVGPEVNIAVTDCLLALGRKENLDDNTIDGGSLDIFYVPQGTILSLYGGTLHYCPFSAAKDGFSTIVVLLDKTNSTISCKRKDLLTKRNKWFIAHINNTAKINAGSFAGLLGEELLINI